MASPKHTAVVLALPKSVPKLLIYALHIAASMTDNKYFPAPISALDVLTENLAALTEAQATVRGRVLGAAEARNVTLSAVIANLHTLKGEVQTVADANAAEAVAIITSSGMRARRSGARHKAQLAASMGAAPGLVILRAKAAAKHAAYEWQCSDNGGKTWIFLGVTTAAETSVPGLLAGVTYLFEFRSTVRSKTTAWSQTVSFMVR